MENKTAERFKISKNVHPNTDGSPWGWIVLENSPRVRVATWSGDREYKFCQQLVDASLQCAEMKKENERLYRERNECHDLREKQWDEMNKRIKELEKLIKLIDECVTDDLPVEKNDPIHQQVKRLLPHDTINKP